MKTIIKKIINNIQSSEISVRKEAIYYIALILEMNTLAKSEHDRVYQYYDMDLLPWNLIFITLNEIEQAEISEKLSQVFMNSDMKNTGILWALGKTEGKSGLIPLLNIIEKCCDRFSKDESSQVLMSLYECLGNNFDFWGDIDLETKALFKNTHILKFLKEYSNSELPDWIDS